MKSRKKLTKRQTQVLLVLVKFTEQFHRQPSYEELGEIVEASSVSVMSILRSIESRGWIEITGKARAIDIPSDVYEAIVKTGELPGEE